MRTSFRYSMERLELVCLNRSLVLVQVSKWVLSTIVVSIIVCINGLRLEACNCVKLLNSGSAEPRQSAKHSTFDLCNFGVFDSIDEGVLSLGCVILKLLGCILFTEGCDLVEIHLEVVGHLFRKLILRGLQSERRRENKKRNK